MLTRIDQKYSKFAFDKVSGILDNDRVSSKDYKSYVKKLPALIKTNGLTQTIAFYISKNNNSSYNELLKHLREFVNETEGVNNQNNNTFMEFIIDLDVSRYRRITLNILTMLNWLKRFVDGKLGE